MNAINKESINLLQEKLKKDKDALHLIRDCIHSFMGYANLIYQLEIYQVLFDKDKEDFKEEFISLERSTATEFKIAFLSLSTLNKLCTQNNIPLIYADTLSNKDIIADVILAYVAEVIGTYQK